MCRHHGLLNDRRAQELPGAFRHGTGRSAGLAIGRSPYVDPWRSKEAQRTRSTGGDATGGEDEAHPAIAVFMSARAGVHIAADRRLIIVATT